MSEYTITVYALEQNGFDFGLDKYPIFDESYRPLLNNAILSYYRFREIGFQNPILWRERLQARMDLIMRNKYNELYKAKQLEFNPLYNIELHETFTHELKSDNQSTQKNISDLNQKLNDTTTRKNDGLGLSSAFPSQEMTENDLTSNLFVDNANKQTANETSSTENKVNTTNIEDTTGNMETNITETYSKDTQGSSAGLPFSKALIQLQEYVNKYRLDEQVIAELKDLFMTIWE